MNNFTPLCKQKEQIHNTRTQVPYTQTYSHTHKHTHTHTHIHTIIQTKYIQKQDTIIVNKNYIYKLYLFRIHIPYIFLMIIYVFMYLKKITLAEAKKLRKKKSLTTGEFLSKTDFTYSIIFI
jgi:hypothetical protein